MIVLKCDRCGEISGQATQEQAKAPAGSAVPFILFPPRVDHWELVLGKDMCPGCAEDLRQFLIQDPDFEVKP